MIKAIKFGDPLVFNPGGHPVGWWTNSFTGTFSNDVGKYPIGIMVNKGVSIRGNSCHYLWGYPESVLWIKKDGSHGVSRVITWTQIPGYRDIVTAIGGVGISDYNPDSEGFCEFTKLNSYTQKTETKKFGDVLRRTDHSVFGFKDDVFFASIMYGSALEIRTECLKNGLTDVVMGDGGSWAAYNTTEGKFNDTHPQYSAVQIINVKDIDLNPIPDRWKYFKYSEFANTLDGNANETKEELIDKLDEFRELIGRAITVTSGFRTVKFNATVNGDPNSEHIYGLAADIKFNFNGYSRESLLRILKYLGFKNVGFYWFGGRIDGTIAWIHCGIRDNGTNKMKIMDWDTSGRLLTNTFI